MNEVLYDDTACIIVYIYIIDIHIMCACIIHMFSSESLEDSHVFMNHSIDVSNIS